MGYNLLDRRIVEAIGLDGTCVRVNLGELLGRGASYADLRHASAMDDIAMYRFLLAVLAWARPVISPAERDELRKRGGFPVEWLGKCRDLFELFGTGPRFYQQGAASAKRDRSIDDLFSEMPAGTEIAHFAHTRDGVTGFASIAVQED